MIISARREPSAVRSFAILEPRPNLSFMNRFHTKKSSAFTLVEVLIALAIFAFIGGVTFEIFRNASILAVKASAITTTQNNARKITSQLRYQLRNAVTVPELLNADLTEVNQPVVQNDTFGVGGMGISFFYRPPNVIIPAADFDESNTAFQQVAYVQNGNNYFYYPDFNGATNPGEAVLLSNDMVPPSDDSITPGYHMPFRYVVDLSSLPLQYNRDALELNLRFLPSESGARLSSVSGGGGQPQNFNNFFQIKTVVWLRNGNQF